MGNAASEQEEQEGEGDGRMVMGIRRELVEEIIGIETGIEGLMIGRAKIGKERWRIVGMYVNKGEMESVARIRELDRR